MAGQPSSYKVQIMTIEIPPHLVKKRPVDTPFRFRTYEEALKTAAEMYPQYEVQIVGSNDVPHWQSAETSMSADDVRKIPGQQWYKVFGMEPDYQVAYDMSNAVKSLSKIRSVAEPRSSWLPPPPSQVGQSGQKRQPAQKRQPVQKRQPSQKRQGRQRGEPKA